MKVLLMPDGMVFVNLTSEQEKDLVKHAGNMEIKDTAKGLKVRGDGKNMYKLLYDLSYKYDIEIV